MSQVKRGKSATPEYRTWRLMKSRCLNPNFPKYTAYGARGIAICDRWRNSFDNFLADMGKRPTLRHSIDRIDRIDNDGDYEPGNCRWATPKEQGRNRSITVRVNYQGRSVTVAELAEASGISYDTLHDRLRRGESPESAVKMPLVAGFKTFTPEQIKAIRDEYALGPVSQSGLAMRYGVAQTTIGRIVRRENYPQVA